MTNELQAYAAGGLTLYAVLLDANGQAWNGAAFEAISVPAWATYDIPLTEAAAGVYLATMPVVGAGVYSYVVYERAGGSPATSDAQRGSGLLAWDGSAEIVPVSAQAVRDAMKLAPSAGDPAAGSVDAHLDDILEDTGTTLPGLIAAGVSRGSSTGYYTDTIDDGTNPLDGVRVQLYTAPNRVGPAYEAYTNALGVFEMWPDPGVYYRWLDLAGYNFSQDVAVTVTEP